MLMAWKNKYCLKGRVFLIIIKSALNLLTHCNLFNVLFKVPYTW